MCPLNTSSSRFHRLSVRFLSISIAMVVSLVAGTSKSDINGNCADELAVGRKSPENQRAVVWNDSFLHYTENTVFGDDWHSSIYVTAVAWGDVDGDGRDELAIARKTSDGHRVLIYRWDNNGNHQEIWTIGEEWSGFRYATDVAFGDVDGDGKMELAIAINSGAEERVSVYRFDFDSEAGTYLGTVLFSTGNDWDTSFYATAVAWGDIDGDGREELAIARKSTSGQRVSVYRWDDGGDAQEIWTTGEDWNDNQYATDVAFGDMDGDGKMELAIARKVSGNYQRALVYRWDDGGNGLALNLWTADLVGIIPGGGSDVQTKKKNIYERAKVVFTRFSGQIGYAAFAALL